MTTVNLDLAPEVIEQAESLILEKKGMSYSQFLSDVTTNAIIEFSDFEDFPLPCTDDLTDEEIMKLFEEGMESIRAGRCHSFEETMKILGLE